MKYSRRVYQEVDCSIKYSELDGRSEEEGKELPDVEVQYVDFTLWQNEVLNSPQMKSQEEYWLNTFAEEVLPLNLPTDFSLSARMEQTGDTISLTIDPNITAQIKTFISNKHVTLFMFLLSLI